MPQDDAITPARQRLGKLIDDRREARGLRQRDVVPHSVTYANLVAGGPYRMKTVRDAFRKLGWDPDSIPDVLAGGNPRELQPDKHQADQMRSADTESEVRVGYEVGGRVAVGWPVMSEEQRKVILDAVEQAGKPS